MTSIGEKGKGAGRSALPATCAYSRGRGVTMDRLPPSGAVAWPDRYRGGNGDSWRRAGLT